MSTPLVSVDKDSNPIAMLLSPEVKEFPAVSPITKLPVAPDNPDGIFIK